MKYFNKKKTALAASIALSIGLISPMANAETDATALGDLAIVPYYTVSSGFTTGVHVINTTDATQVVKVRLRRATDSADVLDFNLVMSPHDEWTGSINASAGGGLGIDTKDTTCTVPEGVAGANGSVRLEAPVTNVVGGEEGYIEVIGMGEATGTVSVVASVVVPLVEDVRGLIGASTHVAGNPRTPADCDAVRANFRANGFTGSVLFDFTPGDPRSGRISNVATNYQYVTLLNVLTNVVTTYGETPDDALKVSFFHRNNNSGLEVGGNAVHIKEFDGGAMISHQSGGNPADPTGSSFPDLAGAGADFVAGGVPSFVTGGVRNLYESVVRADLGAASILNDWSINPQNGVSTDWVVTVPGQYLMVDPAPEFGQERTDYRDLPVRATFAVYDREEDQQDPNALALSPAISAGVVDLKNEVNVIQWGDGNSNVYDSQVADLATIDPSFQDTRFGWAELVLTSATRPEPDNALTVDINESDDQLIFDLTDLRATPAGDPAIGVAPAVVPATAVPVIAFTAWQREFGDAAKSYGHLVYHSRK